MDCNELLKLFNEPAVSDEVATDGTSAAHLQDAEIASKPQTELVVEHRKRLAALAAGGLAKAYIGQALTANQIESMSDSEIGALYAQHEMRMGSLMTGSLKGTVLEVYAVIVGKVIPDLLGYIYPQKLVVVDQRALVAELETNPFAGRVLKRVLFEKYHSHGYSLAPASVFCITFKHKHFVEKDGGTQLDNVTGRDSSVLRAGERRLQDDESNTGGS